MSADLKLTIASTLDEINRLNDAVEEFAEHAGWTPKLLMQIRLVLEEIVINVINYGYGEGEQGSIDVALTVGEDVLTIDIEDDGYPFDPFNEAPEPDLDAALENRRVGGLGVHMVKTIMDVCSYQRRDDRNCVTISKQLAESP